METAITLPWVIDAGKSCCVDVFVDNGDGTYGKLIHTGARNVRTEALWNHIVTVHNASLVVPEAPPEEE